MIIFGSGSKTTADQDNCHHLGESDDQMKTIIVV